MIAGPRRQAGGSAGCAWSRRTSGDEDFDRRSGALSAAAGPGQRGHDPGGDGGQGTAAADAARLSADPRDVARGRARARRRSRGGLRRPARLRRLGQAARRGRSWRLQQARHGQRHGRADERARPRAVPRRRARPRRPGRASARRGSRPPGREPNRARHRADTGDVRAHVDGFRARVLPLVPVHPAGADSREDARRGRTRGDLPAPCARRGESVPPPRVGRIRALLHPGDDSRELRGLPGERSDRPRARPRRSSCRPPTRDAGAGDLGCAGRGRTAVRSARAVARCRRRRRRLRARLQALHRRGKTGRDTGGAARVPRKPAADLSARSAAPGRATYLQRAAVWRPDARRVARGVRGRRLHAVRRHRPQGRREVRAVLVLALMQVAGWSYWLAVPAGIAAMMARGMALERLVIRPTLGQPQFTVVMLTIGVGYLARGLVTMIPELGSSTSTLAAPYKDRVLRLGQAVVSAEQLAAIGVTALMCALFFALFRFSRIGVAMQAASQNQRAAYYMGIPVRRLNALVWGLSAGAAAIAGVLLAPITFVHVNMGFIGLKALPAAVVGGFDSLPGAIVGGLVIGLVEAFAGFYLPEGFKDIAAYVVVLVMLVIRPNGLFGGAARKKV